MITFLDDRYAIDRLKSDYNKHNNLVIGFDFDNTIYDYHKIGLEISPIITLLKQCTNLKFTMCLYTVSTDSPSDFSTHDKVDYCNGLGIDVHYINQSPLFKLATKPFFNILLDDRAGLASSYNILRTALLELKLIL